MSSPTFPSKPVSEAINTKPILLDLFSGAGGAACGYQRAGFYVVGVDHKRQPRYCGDEFIQADALAFLASAIESGYVRRFAAIHASPPCQGYTTMKSLFPHKRYPLLIDPVRRLLCQSGLPYVIENVEGAPMADYPLFNTHRITLCGNSFNLRVYRHRHFESNCNLRTAEHRPHVIRCAPQGRPAREDQFVTVTGNCSGVRMARKAMGIDWMTRDELSQSIPPAYTFFIGQQLLSGCAI